MVITMYPDPFMHPALEPLTMFDLPSFQDKNPFKGSYVKSSFSCSCVGFMGQMLPHLMEW